MLRIFGKLGYILQCQVDMWPTWDTVGRLWPQLEASPASTLVSLLPGVQAVLDAGRVMQQPRGGWQVSLSARARCSLPVKPRL